MPLAAPTAHHLQRVADAKIYCGDHVTGAVVFYAPLTRQEQKTRGAQVDIDLVTVSVQVLLPPPIVDLALDTFSTATFGWLPLDTAWEAIVGRFRAGTNA